MKYFSALLLFQILFLKSIFAQQYSTDIYTNQIFNENIKTVQLFREGKNLSYPVVKLRSDDKLELDFDLLGDQIETYYYTFIHCTKDWGKSDIFQNEYLEGFPENQIEDYVHSFNTTVNYIHYRVSFPNDQIKFILSGNYVIEVYKQDKPDEPVLTRRFIISEEAVKINVSSRRPITSKYSNTHQQLDFTINYNGYNLNDPFKNTYASILQNGRWDIAKTNLKPDIFGNNELKYNSLSENKLFPGGNEFRDFDIKTIKTQTEFVNKIEYLFPNYIVFLHPSENREFKPYFYRKEFNGNYVIVMQDRQKPDIDGDYVYVNFSLPTKQPVTGGKMYISGALNNWCYDKNNVMTYNQAKGEYQCIMFLKQGWYNYEFAFIGDGETKPSSDNFEGSHYETENDYLILLYYRNPRERYDRVIGTETANTLNKMTN